MHSRKGPLEFGAFSTGSSGSDAPAGEIFEHKLQMRSGGQGGLLAWHIAEQPGHAAFVDGSPALGALRGDQRTKRLAAGRSITFCLPWYNRFRSTTRSACLIT